jgi:glycosyltransferase involved in cell wall biosynthesis
MGLVEKTDFLRKHPEAVGDYLRLSFQLAYNRSRGIRNFLFQCDARGHFPYLKPYHDALKENRNVAVYFTGANLGGDVSTLLIQNQVEPDRIIAHSSLVRLTNWDVYLSPTSWGNIFPKNRECPRIQVFHTLADKNIQYGENLIKFDTIFVCGPIHHEFLKRYLFDPYPEAKGQCATFNVGYAKIDALMKGFYDHKVLRKRLNISDDDRRKIILYAPNWETTSALHKYGEGVFDVLKKTDHIVLIKLHYMSLLPADQVGSLNRVDWKEVLGRYEQEENLRIVRDTSIDPYLSLSDVMITDYGGAALEFMCTGKPVVYLDCPEFFEMRGKDIMEYWSRESGHLVSDIDLLPDAIERALRGDASKERLQSALVDKLLYNRGHAVEAGIKVIFDELLSPRHEGSR